MESYGNETVTFDSHIPLGSIIYECSYRQWSPALRDPVGHGIRWIYMRRTPGDTGSGLAAAARPPRTVALLARVLRPDHMIYAEWPPT